MNLNRWIARADDYYRSLRWLRRFNDWGNNLERRSRGLTGRWVDGRLVRDDA